VEATKAAVEEGIVPGGGVALIRAHVALATVKTEDREEKVGLEILGRALEAPIRQIAANAGKEGSVVLDKVKNGTGAFGYDAAKDEYYDLVAHGIVDPTKVTRSALQNAASVSALLLTTEVAVADKPEEKDKGGSANPMAGMGGGMGDF